MGKLLECKPSVVLREELMMELWGMDEFVSDGTLTTLISRLRNKLKEICGEEIIQTKKGQGYFIA
jgi:DNA-binding response OmpR family regulator